MTSTHVEDDRLRNIIEQGASLIWISADGDELVSALSELLELRAAARKVYAGLNARIDDAPADAVPVFDGIAELHDALAFASIGSVAPDRCHQSHVTRISMDASSYDEICVNCGATDHIGGWGALAKPCPKADGSSEEPAGGMSATEVEALPAHPLAKWKTGLELGIHRVHWRSGGSSLVAVGMRSDGRRWFAPCNWVGPSEDPTADFWYQIDRAELLLPYPESEGDHSPDAGKMVVSNHPEIPEGWVVVPLAPTPEMLIAGIDNCATSIQQDRAGTRQMTTPFADECGDIWRAMISASPDNKLARAPWDESAERVAVNRAMDQWQASLKRADLEEQHRVRGALQALVRQLFVFRMMPLERPAETAVERLGAENHTLRDIVSRCAKAIGNGAFVSSKASVDFMSKLPEEIEAATSRLSSERDQARDEVWNLGLVVGQIAKWPRTFFNRYYVEEWAIRTAKIMKSWGDNRAAGVLRVTSDHTRRNKRLEGEADILATDE